METSTEQKPYAKQLWSFAYIYLSIILPHLIYLVGKISFGGAYRYHL